MTFGGSIRIIVAVAAMAVAGGALAAPAKPKAAAAPAIAVPIPVLRSTVYDQLFDPATTTMRQALRDLGAAIDRKDPTLLRDAAGVAAYYAGAGYVALWTADGALTERARALIRRLAEAETDGLDPKSYRVPPIGLGKYAPAGPAALAKADVQLSLALATYARHAYAGRLVPGDVSPNIGYERHLPDVGGVLRSLVLADDPVATLVAYNPPQAEYAALRDMLARLRAAAATEKPIVVPAGANLKPGMTDPRVPLLRQRFELPAYVEPASWVPRKSKELVYDAALVDAVKAFQESERIKADGVIGKGTLAAVNKGDDDRIATVIANMERWRWMPRYLGRYYVRVNIPDFTLDVHKDGSIIHSTRIVVGKVELQTPIFSDEIEHIIVNPAWNVPSSIIAKEYLPALRNGGVPKGFEVFARVGGRFRAVDPRMIDWARVDAKEVQFRQPPGERNALGVVKFMFPNKYAVYLHDTPSKSLFKNDYRAYSHGCMRVMNPWDFADALLTEEGWNSAKLKKLVGRGEKKVDLREHIYVHVTYFTAWVDEGGDLQLRNDVYGHDRRIEEAFGLIPAKG